MCGISGYMYANGCPIRSNSINRKMLLAQKHRGPDDSGIRAFSLKNKNSVELSTTVDETINGVYEGILGFNRLSILDISLNGHQPMISNDGNVILVLNGEIYNAFDYKYELENWGYCFKSTSDTEIVLALYLKYGLNKMLELLNGMYAIVVIDFRISCIYCIRDRFGIKPMYYIYKNNLFAFSSELKSFLYLDNFDFKFNIENFDEYLLFRSNINGTLVQDIHSLDPGYYLEFSLKKGLIKKEYFDINNYHRIDTEFKSKNYYKNELIDALSKSVEYQLISDVNIGCQLSGGIDSSIITWLANKIDSAKSFESISVIFNNPQFSEERYIDHVKSTLNIISHKYILDSDYFFSNIKKIAWHLEQPINHPNTVGIYLLSQEAKKYVTVLLSGEGADETFGGYSRFGTAKYPFNLRAMYPYFKRNFLSYQGLLLYFSSLNRIILSNSFMPLHIAKIIFEDFDIVRALKYRKEIYDNSNDNMLDKHLKYELKTYLPDLLIRQDKMSMAHSIENRVPFLDYNLVDFSFNIPEQYLFNEKQMKSGAGGKTLLKEIAEDVFGHNFAFRDKCGFGIPLIEFFMNKDMCVYINDVLLPNIKKRGIMNFRYISRLFKNIQYLHHAELEALWIVLSFEIWAILYLDISKEISKEHTL